MPHLFPDSYSTPGIRSALETAENQFWWDRWENQIWFPIQVDGSARDAGNTAATTTLRPGLLLRRINTGSDKGKYKEWSKTAAADEIDAGEYFNVAILGHSINMQIGGSDQDRYVGWAMVGGYAKADRIIAPGSSSLSIVGHADEHLIRAHLWPQIHLSDFMTGGRPPFYRIKPRTTDYTVKEEENGTWFTTEGAAGAVNFTLPSVNIGLYYTFLNLADQNMTVTAAPADSMIVFNDLAADSVALSTAGDLIGGGFRVYGISATKWYVEPINWSDGTAGLVQTVTIAT